ncbi:hypothetical protein ACJMK2_031978, partial [Sinanodonta woodiana]
QSEKVSDAVLSTGRHFQVSKTYEEVKPSRPIGRHMVPRTFDGKDTIITSPVIYNEDHSRPAGPPVAKSSTSIFEATCPRPGNESSRTDSTVKVNAEEMSGIDKHAIYLTNEDRTQKSKTKEKTTFPPVETGDAGRIKTAKSNEHHATSSSNDINRNPEYEQNFKILEVRVRQLSAEKDGLLNRLSEIGAIKLTENNPNVTDLSDPNRPEKVVQELSEIYDNEWTNAYERLTIIRKKNTDVCAKKLLQVLQ